MKIALISPKGPLYRHRGGIFRRSLRYQPLTLTTLAALVPPELDAELELIDEGHRGRRSGPRGRSRRHDRHHRHGAARLRAGRRTSARAASPWCSAGRTSRWCRTTRSRTPTRSSSATPRTPGRSCCAILPRGTLQPRYDQAPDLSLAGRPFRAPRPAAAAAISSPTTSSRRRAAASTTASSASCRRPGAASRSRSRSRTWSRTSGSTAPRKLIFVDLNLIADRGYAERLFEALIPLKRAVVRPGHGAAGRGRCRCWSWRRGAAAAAC